MEKYFHLLNTQLLEFNKYLKQTYGYSCTFSNGMLVHYREYS